MAGHAIPIKAWKVLGAGDAQPRIRRLKEKASQTFLEGTPVQVDVAGSTGYLINCPSMTNVATAIIAGFSTEPGSNLATAATPKTTTYGSVPNQSSAVLIPQGAPLNLGDCGLLVAGDETRFVGKVADTDTLAQTMIGQMCGLTVDTNSYWLIDTTKSTAAAGACLQITDLIDAIGTTGSTGGRVAFRVLAACQQLNSMPSA